MFDNSNLEIGIWVAVLLQGIRESKVSRFDSGKAFQPHHPHPESTRKSRSHFAFDTEMSFLFFWRERVAVTVLPPMTTNRHFDWTAFCNCFSLSPPDRSWFQSGSRIADQAWTFFRIFGHRLLWARILLKSPEQFPTRAQAVYPRDNFSVLKNSVPFYNNYKKSVCL